jgi:hypothetical protein
MVIAMSKPPLDPNILAQFTGSERFYRHAMIRDIVFTEGVRYVADTVGAHWLIDEIGFAQKHAPKLRNEDFQNWELVVSTGGSAVLICDDGNGHRLYAKQIEWTDFPAPGVRFYFCNETLMLPGEY